MMINRKTKWCRQDWIEVQHCVMTYTEEVDGPTNRTRRLFWNLVGTKCSKNAHVAMINRLGKGSSGYRHEPADLRAGLTLSHHM